MESNTEKQFGEMRSELSAISSYKPSASIQVVNEEKAVVVSSE